MARARSSSSKNNSAANLGFEAKLWLAAGEVRNENDEGRKRPHLRHHHQESPRFSVIAVPPSSFLLQTFPAWVQHFIYHLAPAAPGSSGGMAGFVVANGSMSSNQSGEGEIRRALDSGLHILNHGESSCSP